MSRTGTGWRRDAPPVRASRRRLTFLSGLRHDRIVAPFVLDGPINSVDLPGFFGERLAHFPGLSLEGDGALEAER